MVAADPPSRNPSGTSPVERAFHLLQIVVAAGEPIGVRELARRSGLPRSTVGRTTALLTDLAMLQRTGDGSVVPGRGLATLQPPAWNDYLLPELLRPLLAELVATFGENAALSIDDQDALLYLAQVSTDHAVSVPDVSNERHHFHLVAPGLVTMAAWSTTRLRDYLAEPLEAATPWSMTSIERLEARLNQVGERGWCWTDQELDEGVNGLAVPLIIDDELVATVSLFGPSYRFNPTARPDLGRDLSDLVRGRAAALLPRHPG